MAHSISLRTRSALPGESNSLFRAYMGVLAVINTAGVIGHLAIGNGFMAAWAAFFLALTAVFAVIG